jgi:methionine-rich copper-binding protein CopC
MARIGRCVGRGHGVGRAPAGLGGLVLALVVLVTPSGPADAHARLVGSSPEAGATVERAPDRVVIELDAKPATIEGDPLQVYAPDGRRVDARDPHVDEQGRRLAVTVDARQPRPSGAYHVAYRVVSADSHVITGRLSFTVGLPSPAEAVTGVEGTGPAGITGLPARSVPASDDPGIGSHHLVAGGRLDPRPRLVAAGALALAALALLVRVLWAVGARWRRPTPRPTLRQAPAGPRAPAARHHDRRRTGPDRRRAAPHGRPSGPRAHRHPTPPRAASDRDDEAFWTGPGRGRGDRRAPTPSGAPWWAAPEDDLWP